MKNSIAERITDFIKNYPPFDNLSYTDLYKLAVETNVLYLDKDETLFNQGKPHNNFFYLVNQGAIRLYRQEGDKTLEIEMCDEGDVFGLRPLIVNENYNLNAKAYEESIVYAIPISIFNEQFVNNSEISKYLITRFASNSTTRFSQEENERIFADYKRTRQTDYFSSKIGTLMTTAISCNHKHTIREAALIMSENKISSIFILKKNKPTGVITNKVLLHTVATGKFSIDENVKEIMGTPVITASADISIAEAQIIMLKKKVENVCITVDGSPDSKMLGMVTQQDIVASLSNNPAVLMKQITRARTISRLRDLRQQLNDLLKRYIDQHISFTHTLTVVAELNETINQKAVELSVKELDKTPPCKFSFFALGSQARKEQLVPTDQDNGIIFDDVPEEEIESTRAFFMELAGLITKNLHSIGFEYCPAEMMASNPKWCLSKTEWKDKFKDWIYNPTEKNILLTAIFFDFNFVYGSKKLVDELSASVYEHTKENNRFFMFLAQDALKSPSPLGFFRQFLVDQDGAYKDHFNIKQRAIMPLIDAARILTLQHNLKGVNNTAERYYKLRELEPQNADVYEACAYAFKALLKFKTKNGLASLGDDDGKFIKLESLSKSDKVKLRRCFKPIKSIQEIITVRFQANI
ncbi:DUF294 nucleotidyltransferase-like domain-containing protein [Wenyingzhuangia aestuarii]|uniref:DUF294 nucleotidyltransferase-like domain-containing protein n=1 Tax=Wenyingzhuangia aestuarii TaxID=1647582 RepID=UPI00143A85A4|nr:DUF294 nucleotidyltransferase-like domain-containing protein [Wenyingzhuangia aestuarii]NJB83003.1 CBS domain-containing protein [Wenyingzhuangia aestuarii]